jgi:galactosamine-6-phosphate isomerase
MQLKIYNNYEALSAATANAMIDLIKQKPNAVICIASGDSPKLACELFCKKVKEENIDVSKFFFVGLDEWVGLSPTTFGSCHNDFQKRLIQPLGLSSTQYHLFDACPDSEGRRLAPDLQSECKKMDTVIKDKGGIDLMIVGIGMNGHVGFNEPGVDFNLLSHVINLDETTISVGQRYFKEKVVLQQGITLGLAHLLNAKMVFLLANGERKATVIKKAVEEAISNLFPASIMQQHANGCIIIDEGAASLLNKPN